MSYPVFLARLAGRRAVVVGGDHEAARKTRELLDAGFGRVDVIAPDPDDELAALDHPRLHLHRRRYRPGDLTGALLVVASERDRVLNERLRREADATGALLNALDDPPRCHVYAGAQVRRGDLVVAIGTNGVAPALSARLRQRFEAELGDEIAALLEIAAALRPEATRRIERFEGRRAFWYALVDDPELRTAIEAGDGWSRARALLERHAERPDPVRVDDDSDAAAAYDHLDAPALGVAS